MAKKQIEYNGSGLNVSLLFTKFKNQKDKKQIAFKPLLYEVFFREGKKEIKFFILK